MINGEPGTPQCLMKAGGEAEKQRLLGLAALHSSSTTASPPIADGEAEEERRGGEIGSHAIWLGETKSQASLASGRKKEGEENEKEKEEEKREGSP